MRALSILVLASALAMGQAADPQRGIALVGTVEDQAGGVIPGAKLTLTNKSTRVGRTAIADDGGAFSFTNVAPGKYSIRGEASGFEATDMHVTVAEQPLEPIKVKLGISVKEEVTIKDDQNEQTTSPQANADAVNLGDDFLKALPSQMEDVLPIISNFLNPAAQGTEGLSVVVDGVEDTQVTVPTDAIRRVLINRNPYSVSYRRPGQGRVEVITKDGSRRRYDGSFGYNLRNSFFDSRDTFTRRLGLPRPKLDRRLLLATFGGPIPWWKTVSFLVSGNRLINHESVVTTPVTPAGRQVLHIPTTKRNTNLLARLDLRPNQTHSLSGRYYYYQIVEINRGVGGKNSLSLPEQGYGVRDSGQRILFADRAIFSPSLLGELHFSFERRGIREGQRANQPTINVQGDFLSGPSPIARSNKQTTLEGGESVTYTHGNHTIRFGGGFRRTNINAINETNFNGTYTFQGLFNYLEKSPSLFEISQGDPKASFSQWEAYGFFEDEIKLRRWISLTPGIRYDWQSNMQDYNNFGPRLSLAFAPGKQKTVLRAGGGIFYERLAESITERGDAAHIGYLTIRNPSFPDPFGAGTRFRPKPNAWLIAHDLAAPYLIMGSMSLERRLWGKSVVSVEYQRIHGAHLFRTRNVNEPFDSLGLDFIRQHPSLIGRRPDPNFNLVSQVESSASSTSSALKVTFQGRFGKWFKGMAQYTHSRTMDDTNGTFTYPANSYDLRSEWGLSTLDQKHRFNFMGTFDLPRAFRLGAILTVGSGVPFDITTDFDDNGNTIANDRPPGVTRNTGQGPPIRQLDLRLTKLFRLPTPFPHKAGKSDRKLRNLEFSIDAFNVFNHPNTPKIVGALGSHVAGQATTSTIARTLQLSLKYSF